VPSEHGFLLLIFRHGANAQWVPISIAEPTDYPAGSAVGRRAGPQLDEEITRNWTMDWPSIGR